MNMMNRRELRLLLMLCDLGALVLSFELAIRLRPALNRFFTAQLTEAELRSLVPPLGLVLLLWVAAALWLRLYRPRRGPQLLSALSQVIEAMVVVTVLTIVVPFFVRNLGEELSRSFVIFLALLGVMTMALARGGLWLLLRLFSRADTGRERVLLIGSGSGVKALIARLERTAARAVELCGVVTPQVGRTGGVLGNPVPVVGTVAELPALINRLRIRRVIVVEKEVPPEELHGCLSICTRMGVPFSRTAGLLERSSTRVEVCTIGKVSLIEVRGLEFTRVQEIIKRVFDLVVASLLLIALSPLLALIAALVLLTSAGPVFYVAPRVGRGGRYFPFLKFRSMVEDADAHRDELQESNEKHGHLFKLSHDPRVTALGRVMRRFSLDELPQLFNVLSGDMSLVGPRPLPSRDLDPDGLSHDHRLWALQRTRVPPGITGLWQVQGRSDLGFEDMLRLDMEYVRNWNLSLDVKILLRTLPAILRGRGAV